jgi:hypothetical protein
VGLTNDPRRGAGPNGVVKLEPEGDVKGETDGRPQAQAEQQRRPTARAAFAEAATHLAAALLGAPSPWSIASAILRPVRSFHRMPVPFKVHLLTKAGRVMRARSEPVRAFFTKDEAVRFAGRQLGGHYAVYHKDRKIWPIP